MNEPLKPINTSFYDIQAFADANDLAYDEAFAELLRWYDGYQFSPERLVEIINPVSLGNALSNRVLRNYWEATAGSTLIFDALKAKNAAPIDFADEFEVATLYRGYVSRLLGVDFALDAFSRPAKKTAAASTTIPPRARSAR